VFSTVASDVLAVTNFGGRVASVGCVSLSLTAKYLSNEMTFGVDIWHSGPSSNLGQVQMSRSTRVAKNSQDENIFGYACTLPIEVKARSTKSRPEFETINK